ncbi:hypothetical protein RSAG8_12195, partial [Rhizoctonia solani AG-8 WAC10335]
MSTEQITKIIKIVGDTLGVEVIGSISAHSIARILLEGLVKAQMQIAQELSQANYVTMCSDGTTIKNLQYEAKLLFIHLPGQSNNSTVSTSEPASLVPMLWTLGVHKAPSHTSQQQLNGWLNALDQCCNRLNKSHLREVTPLTSAMVVPKLQGILTDHAADQKWFVQLVTQWKQNIDHNLHAVRKLKKMMVNQQLYKLTTYLDSAANGISNWRELLHNQQAAVFHDAWLVLVTQTGETKFQKLSLAEQFDTDFLAWAGCCMHKELNAVKGGASSMAITWEELGLKPPIPLQNKYESTGDALSRTTDKQLMQGGIKLARLAGVIFNNNNDKKRYQSSIDNFFECQERQLSKGRKRLAYGKRCLRCNKTRGGDRSKCQERQLIKGRR